MQMTLRATVSIMGVLGLAALAAAADVQKGTRVTDPAVLASLGFPARTVLYLAPGVPLGENTPWPQGYGLGPHRRVRPELLLPRPAGDPRPALRVSWPRPSACTSPN